MSGASGLPEGIVVAVPGEPTFTLRHLLLDYNGTVAFDGQWIDGVLPRLRALSEQLHIEVLTSDTYGTLAQALRGQPVQARIVASGAEKAARAAALSDRGVVAIGNGRNDVQMLQSSTLGIAILGPEGAHAATLHAAQLVAPSILAALDLLAFPARLVAALRT